MDENPYKAPQEKPNRKRVNIVRRCLFVLGFLFLGASLIFAIGAWGEMDTGSREAFVREAFLWGTGIFGVLAVLTLSVAYKWPSRELG